MCRALCRRPNRPKGIRVRSGQPRNPSLPLQGGYHISRGLTVSISARHILKVRGRRTRPAVQQRGGGKDDLGHHDDSPGDGIDARRDIVVNSRGVASREAGRLTIEWRPTVRELGIAVRQVSRWRDAEAVRLSARRQLDRSQAFLQLVASPDRRHYQQPLREWPAPKAYSGTLRIRERHGWHAWHRLLFSSRRYRNPAAVSKRNLRITSSHRQIGRA